MSAISPGLSPGRQRDDARSGCCTTREGFHSGCQRCG